MSVESLFLECAARKLREFTGRIEVCLGKLNEDQIWARGHENENAVGNLVLHLTGNVRQWIISTFSDKPDTRVRHREFDTRGGIPTAELAAGLRATVDEAARIIAALNTTRLEATWTIQNYKVSGVENVFHVVEHFAQHTAQIMFITKALTSEDLGFFAHLNPPPAEPR
jgi:uncharacterized damage-inducible protein DinB